MTLNGGEKKSDRLGTLGLEEYQGGEYPRFYFCLTYCRSDAKEFRNTSGHRQMCALKSQEKPLLDIAPGKGKPCKIENFQKTNSLSQPNITEKDFGYTQQAKAE